MVEFRTDKEGAITQFDSASLACIASYPGGKFNFIKKVDGKEPEVQYSDYEVETDVSEDYEDKSFLTDKWVCKGALVLNSSLNCSVNSRGLDNIIETKLRNKYL